MNKSMKESLKTKRLSKIIQVALNEVFSNILKNELYPALVTITDVELSVDYGIAKIYISVMNSSQNIVLDKLGTFKKDIRKHLGNKISNKIRKIPRVKFVIDDSLHKALRIQKLLKGLEE